MRIADRLRSVTPLADNGSFRERSSQQAKGGTVLIYCALDAVQGRFFINILKDD